MFVVVEVMNVNILIKVCTHSTTKATCFSSTLKNSDVYKNIHTVYHICTEGSCSQLAAILRVCICKEAQCEQIASYLG